jgi:nucleoside-triphosphatase THEP1
LKTIDESLALRYNHSEAIQHSEKAMMHIILLSAPRRSGKTTACQSFIDRARRAGLRIGGILAPARHDQAGHKVGIDVHCLLTGETRILGTIVPIAKRRTVGHYQFDETTMQWAVEQVLHALQTPIDVVVIDEIGPLELLQRHGFAPALDCLPLARAANAILLVRSELLEYLQEMLTDLQPVTITMIQETRDQLPARLLAAIRVPASRHRDEPSGVSI